MLSLIFIFIILFVIRRYWGLSFLSIGISLNLGAVVAAFAGPFWGLIAAILFAILASDKF